ncbi:MAG: 5-carboxymethyl-2-hydroxymuconate Delta-isomerase [Paucimonas sp.]|jgi:5-carboxymethyl-2-hydroxymuconate isomerase|uniref:5-carboxymethyl-2-hydroxymuconate Delta-isomerase n=1 Tax=Pantoea sp. Cy-639 TaxID=2608360 RepID=UPI001421E46B|nr:5-carboxymethyl-2-hydroxymuconate Delta-isomerase [Pantoea sp. Cy-639]MDR2306933.1 5-carboxymethyl-2-hydroxymuconate Delta-isomerase [Paucimonas sp.]NIF16045.1 5-carboxymethyl-2-hydroxymuconate Delta-isomerase [Pantoea sp. Cy-639]
MPHLNLEYSDSLGDLDVDVLLMRLNHALVASGQFADELDIKSRAQRFSRYRIGTADGDRAFAHVRLAILSGRSPEVKKQLSGALLKVLQGAIPAQDGLDIQLCVEVLDIDRDAYAKQHLPG